MSFFGDFFQQPVQSNVIERTAPSWAIPFQQGGLQQAWNVANRPGTGVYGGTQVAPFNQDQFNAFDMTRRQAGNTGLFDTANRNLQSIMGGTWEPGGGASGGGGGGFGGFSAMPQTWGQNQFIDEKNIYGQDNPYLQQQIDATTQDMTKSWENSAMAGWMNNMASRGASGGSNRALTMLGGDIANDLQRNIGNMSTGVRSDDYNRRAQLEESRLGRRFQSGENELGRQASLAAANAGAAGNAAAAGASRDAQNYNTRIQAALSGLGMAGNIDALGYSGANRLLGIGNQMQGNMQDMINADMRNYQQWYNEPERRLGLFGNQQNQFIGNNSQTNIPSYGPSNAQNLAALYGLGRGFGLWGG